MKFYNRTGKIRDQYMEMSVGAARKLIRDVACVESETFVANDVNDIVAWLPFIDSIEIYQHARNNYIDVCLMNGDRVTFIGVGIENVLVKYIDEQLYAGGGQYDGV